MKYGLFLAILGVIGSTPVSAEPSLLSDFLAAMDRTAVRFSGGIKYDSSEEGFTFYDENREPFGVTIDTGRDTRERIEAECEVASFMFSYSDLCTITGSGTVEIRGSRVFLSIEHVDQLDK